MEILSPEGHFPFPCRCKRWEWRACTSPISCLEDANRRFNL